MNKKFLKLTNILLLSSLVLLLTWCAEKEPTAPDAAAIPIETSIEAGPAEGAQLAFNSTVTFTWDGTISPGTISAFTYTLAMGTDTLNTATNGQKTYSKSNLETGSYTFSVYAMGTQDEEEVMDATPAVRNFTVIAADADAPVVTILRSPKQNSYASTGSNLAFEWTATDPSAGGGIVSYQYALEDQSVAVGDVTWSTANLATTQKSFASAPNGDWRFWVQATDVSGLDSTASVDFDVKTPDVLFVIDRDLTVGDITFWHTNALRDFAYEDFYLTSDPADFLAKIDVNTYSSIVWAGNNGTSILPGGEFARTDSVGSLAEALMNYVNAGGHLWISGGEILYDLGDNTWPATTYDDTSFVKDVLHIVASDEASDNFKGAVSAGITGYSTVVVDGNATFTYCDRVDPEPGVAETIYTFNSDIAAFDGQSVAVRYPAGDPTPPTTTTSVVYCGFYITDTDQPAACKAEDVYLMATTIFTDFGENED